MLAMTNLPPRRWLPTFATLAMFAFACHAQDAAVTNTGITVRSESHDDWQGPDGTWRHKHHGTGNAIVSIGHDSHLAAGESADSVVSIMGSSTTEGDVSDAVVSLFGNPRGTGTVGDAAVAVFGNTYVDGQGE